MTDEEKQKLEAENKKQEETKVENTSEPATVITPEPDKKKENEPQANPPINDDLKAVKELTTHLQKQIEDYEKREKEKQKELEEYKEMLKKSKDEELKKELLKKEQEDKEKRSKEILETYQKETARMTESIKQKDEEIAKIRKEKEVYEKQMAFKLSKAEILKEKPHLDMLLGKIDNEEDFKKTLSMANEEELKSFYDFKTKKGLSAMTEVNKNSKGFTSTPSQEDKYLAYSKKKYIRIEN